MDLSCIYLAVIDSLYFDVITLISGIYAGDEDSYKVFADVFDPLIMEYHGLPEGFKHTSDMDHTKIVGNIDPAAPVHRYAFECFLFNRASRG